MQYNLNIALDRIASPQFYILYIQIIHKFINNLYILDARFETLYLQGNTPDEGRTYKIPEEFSLFEDILKSQGEYIHNNQFLVMDTEFYLLGLWNGKMYNQCGVGIEINFSQTNFDKKTAPHDACIEFSFIPQTQYEFFEIKALVDKIVSLATSILPFKYATFYDLEYVSSFEDHRPEIYTGGILYCNPKIINQLEGFKRPLSSDLIELAALKEPLDLDNSEHIKKSHAFEKMLQKNKDFRQLIQR